MYNVATTESGRKDVGILFYYIRRVCLGNSTLPNGKWRLSFAEDKVKINSNFAQNVRKLLRYFSAFANLQDSIIALHFLSMSSQPSMLEFVGKRRRKNALTVEKEVWIFTTTTRYLLQSIFAEFNHIKNRYQRVDVHIRSVIDRVFHLVPFFTTKGFFFGKL